MNVKELIEVLTKEVAEEDREIANIEFYFGDKELDIKNMTGFSLSPDIIIELEEIESPIIRPATFKNIHHKMVKDTIEKIKNDG